MSRTTPLPRYRPAKALSPRPRAMEAKGAAPPLTIEAKAEIRIMTEPVTPIPARASVPMP